ncbi:malectin domain-containing carbohydrate-binding protein, partial [Coleofasciculus chthonoplastes]|uniref:malectin domain-containing carbohydrate-binding protein n=1 Tax=Coleofasciculus chthonoplastes TaxID=64178 RepID=UPI0032F13BF8
GTPISATYSILAPGGTWDTGDNGTYAIAMAANQVTDTSGNGVVSGSLGSFDVNAAPPVPTDVRINVGGGNYTDTQGNLWLADTYFTNGNTSSTNGSINGTVEDTLYQTDRYQNSFGYDIPVTNGTYTVNLHFAETFFAQEGQRAFDVAVEGDPFLNNLDILSVTGTNNTALTTSLANVTVTDGILDLDLTALVNNAKLSAIEILANPIPDTIVPTASLSATDVTVRGGTEYQFSVTYFDNQVIDSTTPDNNDILVTGPNGFSQLASLETIQPDSNGSPLRAIYKFAAPGGNWDGTDDGIYTIALAANQVSDASGNVVTSGTLGSFEVSVTGTALPPSLINSGGGDYTSVDSRLWQADTYFIGGGTNGIAATTDIGNTFDDTLYQSERWHNNTLSYEIPVPEAGTYTVNLNFAEIYWADAGLRVFDVMAEGNLIADDLDIYAQVGGNAALRISDNVGVTDGILNIDLVGVVEKPKISSIEVVKEEEAHGGHPFLHVVIDAPDYAVDYNGNGSEGVTLLGNESHTHEPGQSLTSWTWEDGATVLGTGEDIQATLGVGAHTVSLTIEDSNSPPDHLTDAVDLNVFPINAVGGVLVSYDLDADIDNLTAPEFQEVLPLTPKDPNDLLDGSLHLKENGSFGTLGSSSYSNHNVAVVFKGKFAPTTPGDYDFTVNGGTDSDIYINGNLVTGTQTLTAGTTYDLEVRVARAAGEVNPIEVLASIDGVPPAPLQGTNLTHDQTSLLPFINPPNDTSVSTFGGEIITLEGIAFWEGDASDQVKVHWGNTILTEPDIQVNQGTITFATPPGTFGDSVTVTVETPNGISNVVTFNYVEGTPPVKFLPEQQTGATPFSPTQATWGPDGRLYVGTITGAIEIYTFDDTYQVTNTQTVSSIAGLSNSNILGIAFNPFDDPADSPKIYVAHSELFAHNGGQGPVTEFSPYNGQVSILEGANFSTVTPLITGLPVSNHDHGINGLAFDNHGDLLIAVGGNTNAGVPDNNIGGLPESPLSGAILKAKITDPNFNGTVEYELTPGETAPSGFDANDQVYGEIVNVVSGVDVSVFASGQRNPFDIVWTTENRLYGTDNGANASSAFGAASTGANTEKSITGQPDEINLLVEGNYYGHANRNQGRFDPRQYVWYSPNDTTGDFTPPLGTVASSTNGISEYRATTFLGQMQGNLLAQKWNGTVYNASIAADGSFESLETIINVPTALDVLHGPGGAILGIDFTDDQITVSLPDDLAAVFNMTAYDIFPWRSPAVGGATFTIGGANFDPDLANTTVTIGGQTALLTSVSAKRIQGIIPEQTTPTGDLLDVVVTNDGTTSTIPDAFIYLSSTLAFGDTEFTVNEDGTSVAQVSVTRTGVSFGAVSATLSQTDGTATSGVDYTNAPITVSFADGEIGTKVVSIPILEDTEVEGDETINLVLDSPTPWAMIGAQGEARLRILDNEALPTTTASATFTIDPPGGSINNSTFGSDSFQITNTSTGGEKLDRVVIDLSSSILPDLVFDPNGSAGDTAAKVFTIDTDSGVGYLSHTLLSSHDGGFDALEILFNDFDPTETLTFSIDVDPTSIKGLPQPGPSDSADVSGLELTGTQVRADFDDGSTLVGDTYRIPNSLDGSQMTLQSDLPGQPTIAAVGLSSTRAKVSNENQTIQVTGPAGAEVMLLVTEAALFTENGDGNAFDVDPFEANSIIAITEQSATLDGTGTVDIPVTLTKSDPEGGLNYIVAVVKYLDGTTSPLSDTIILELL